MPPAKSLSSLTKTEFTNWLNSFDTVLSDCDGVLWISNELLPNSPEAMVKLKDLGKKLFYLTNNSTKSRSDYAKKCKLLGFPAEKEDIIGTAFLIGNYLSNLKFQKTAYVIGASGIANELDLVGIKHFGIGPDTTDCTFEELMETVKLKPDVGAVVVGFDQHFSYPKLLKAASYLADRNCLFIGSNRDESFPAASRNLVMPGSGSILASVETASRRKATVMGKPDPFIFETVRKDWPIDPKRTLMIGDKANTDILLGKNCGLQTLMVFSGVTSKADLESYENSENPEDHLLVPDYYLDCLGDLITLIENAGVSSCSDNLDASR